MEKRRRVPRVAVSGWVGTCTIEEGVDGPFDCRLLDISMLGAGVEICLGVKVEGAVLHSLVGHHLAMELMPPSGVSVSLRLAGEVMYTTPGPLGGTRVGLQFVGLTESERAVLDALDLMRAVW